MSTLETLVGPGAALSPEQRATVERWLAEEKLSGRVVASRCRKEFGVSIPEAETNALVRISSRKRNLERIQQSARQANELVKQITDEPADVFKAVVTLAGQAAFHAAINASEKEKPDPKMFGDVLKLLLAVRKNDREETKLAFAREKWEFDVARTCFEHHAEIQAITADTSLDEDARLLAIRRRLFGANLPD